MDSVRVIPGRAADSLSRLQVIIAQMTAASSRMLLERTQAETNRKALVGQSAATVLLSDDAYVAGYWAADIRNRDEMLRDYQIRIEDLSALADRMADALAVPSAPVVSPAGTHFKRIQL